MVLLGVILVLLAIAAGVLLFLATQSLTTPVDLDAAGYQVGMTPLALLITGAVVMLVLWLGLAMIRGSIRRRRRPGREAKEAERQARWEESIRSDERARAEETHQSALAERDRQRDEEFAAREAEAEQRIPIEAERRIRADERRRMEDELSSRAPAAGGPAVTEGAAGTGAAATEVEYPAGRHEDLRGSDAEAVERADRGGLSDRGEVSDRGELADRERSDDEDDFAAAPRDEAAAADSDAAAEESGEHSRPAYRTVADKIMGREPHDQH